MTVLTVKEAVARVHRGQTLEGVVLEENSRQQVNVRDAMILSEGGILIPEENIYYNDADIEYDEDIDELTITSGPVQLSWEEKAKRAAAHQNNKDLQGEDDAIAPDEAATKLNVQLHLIPEVKAWLEQQEDPAQLLERLVENFYQTQQMIKKK